MNRYVAGVVAGLAATLVLACVMIAMEAAGILPALDIIGTLAAVMAVSIATAWFAHFSIGAVWGALFAFVGPRLPGQEWWVRGMVFALAPWLVMMLVLFPQAGQGLFGLGRGIGMPVITLLQHLIFGGLMGALYGALARPVGLAPPKGNVRAA